MTDAARFYQIISTSSTEAGERAGAALDAGNFPRAAYWNGAGQALLAVLGTESPGTVGGPSIFPWRT